MATETEENYIKAIFKITEKNQGTANTNAVAQHLNTSPASVTDMLKRLSEKEYFHYEKYKGVYLTTKGIKLATNLVRKHRLWEVFLVDKLKFQWDEVHDIAEQLEHVDSDELITRLDTFLGNPKYDPHGDPIPNADGKFTLRSQTSLMNLQKGETGIVVGVRNHDTPFLQYLNKICVNLGTKISVVNNIDFDHSKEVSIDDENRVILSQKACVNIYVKKTND
ncbi:MAG: metal-dependent transcriptional regulator [Saprospiraceae bacterium]|nr:metal-dependent transcriptional regulator [Bacteroidia bacterium]NNE13564.1 metal-dependent transcriptional regulator [Saprospiraceae bacterium]NNL93060.1 metal-dependent transcriptional regulator [Saprospiraceae bacterium]